MDENGRNFRRKLLTGRNSKLLTLLYIYSNIVF